MPHFSEDGNDMYICQVCGRQLDSVKHPPVWRTDVTGNKSAGNVCPTCLKGKQFCNPHGDLQRPISLYEHCRRESGFSKHADIVRYMNRYYGHA
jgi:hypothetical protein